MFYLVCRENVSVCTGTPLKDQLTTSEFENNPKPLVEESSCIKVDINHKETKLLAKTWMERFVGNVYTKMNVQIIHNLGLLIMLKIA